MAAVQARGYTAPRTPDLEQQILNDLPHPCPTDGFVLARQLHLRGFVARVVYCGDREAAKRETDAGINLSVLEQMDGVEIVDCSDGAALATVLARWSGQ